MAAWRAGCAWCLPCQLRVGTEGVAAHFLSRARGGFARHGGDTRPRRVLLRHATRARRTANVGACFVFSGRFAERGGRGTAGFELQTWLSSSFVAHTQAKHFPSRHIGKWGVPFVILQRFVRWHSRASTPRVDLMWRALACHLLSIAMFEREVVHRALRASSATRLRWRARHRTRPDAPAI